MTHSTVDVPALNALASAGYATLTMPPSSVDDRVPMEITASRVHLFLAGADAVLSVIRLSVPSSQLASPQLSGARAVPRL